jgi:hypothetical protein
MSCVCANSSIITYVWKNHFHRAWAVEHSNYSCFTSGDFIREVHSAPTGSPPCSELARRPCVRPSPTPFLEVQVRINGQNTVQISESHGVRHILWKHRYIVKFRWWTSEVHLMNIWSFTNKIFKHHTCSIWLAPPCGNHRAELGSPLWASWELTLHSLVLLQINYLTGVVWRCILV